MSKSEVPSSKKPQRVGILTAGGDSPGLSVAIRGFGRAVTGHYGMEPIGFQDGVRELAENRFLSLDSKVLLGILTLGDTILGISCDKVHKMMADGEVRNMVPIIVDNCEKDGLDAFVCIGGDGTAKNAQRPAAAGLPIIHLSKTIDNDIAHTDTSFGFSIVLGITTEAVDRLHSTAHSHHRVIIVEIMDHHAGWLALSPGIVGGADIILLPEVPYSVDEVVGSIEVRTRHGANFSVVAITEDVRDVPAVAEPVAMKSLIKQVDTPEGKAVAKKHHVSVLVSHRGNAYALAERFEAATGLESRVTILGYVQRGGTPDAQDRLLGTLLGRAGADLVARNEFGFTVAPQAQKAVSVPLEEIVGRVKMIPLDHPWIDVVHHVGIGLGD